MHNKAKTRVITVYYYTAEVTNRTYVFLSTSHSSSCQYATFQRESCCKVNVIRKLAMIWISRGAILLYSNRFEAFSLTSLCLQHFPPLEILLL